MPWVVTFEQTTTVKGTGSLTAVFDKPVVTYRKRVNTLNPAEVTLFNTEATAALTLAGTTAADSAQTALTVQVALNAMVPNLPTIPVGL